LKAAETILSQDNLTDLLILEARDRVGGRCNSVNDFVDGTPVELGCEYLYADKEITNFFDEEKIPYAMLDSSTEYFNESELLDENKLDELYYNVWRGEEGFVKFVRNEAKSLRGKKNKDKVDKDYESVLEDFEEKNNIEDNLKKQYLNGLVNVYGITNYGIDKAQLSVQITGGSWAKKKHSAVAYTGVAQGGFGNAAKYFSEKKRLDDKIKLDSKVLGVKYNKKSAKVRYQVGQYIKEIKAKFVLITVPLGVLKAGDIDFHPALPKKKRQAIKGMKVGSLNKCFLSWNSNETFWPENCDSSLLITSEDTTSNQWTFFFIPEKYNGQNMLIAYIGGKESEAMENLCDDEVRQMILHKLRRMYGEENVEEPENFMCSRWGTDEFAKGSYSGPVKGRDFYADSWYLWKRVKTLFFAGEATDFNGWFGTANGAWDSGRRSGKAILRKLQPKF